ncbi:MAG: trehalase family glycosidase [Bacteroidota bacterium]
MLTTEADPLVNDLASDAERILDTNWRDGFTIPTAKLYPFQWNWDSGFTSLGHSYFRLDYAIRELESLFSGQWANGMVPHIVFHSETEETYFPNHDFWGSHVNAGAPDRPKTSGITQPAVHGFVLESLLAKYPDDEDLIAFAKHLVPKIVHSHRFFYAHRDPEREGLTFIFHPWESGRDNSPLWDTSMDRIEIKPGMLPEYHRRDTSLAPSEERPTSYQYDRYVYLLLLGKRHRYDEAGIFAESPFVVQDTLMNAALIRSNESLIALGKRFGLDVGEVEEWQQQAVPRFREKLWNADLQTFTSYDVRGDQPIAHQEIGGLTALYAGVPSAEQAQHLNAYLQDLHDRGYYLCPSFDVDSPLFDSKRYWRGPIWSQMNWLIHFGLKRYGFLDTAGLVRGDLIDLVSTLGFYEYFEPKKAVAATLSAGYGGGAFSWTAACTLDLLHEGA